MDICLIVAMAENGVIGRDNALPWRLSGDLRRFKALTMGKPLIMGRKTWQSIGRPLPGRTNIVLTRDKGLDADGVLIAHDAAGALMLAEDAAKRNGAAEIMVIGGAGIYRLFLPRASRLYLTELHAAVSGDTTFPAIEPDDWAEISRERHDAGPGETGDYSFVVLDRR
jgi:dihydrofolate reductase